MTTETTVKCPECGEQVDDYLRMAYKRLYDCASISMLNLETHIRAFMRPGRTDDEDVAVLALGATLHVGELGDLTRAVRHRMAEEAR